MFQRFHAMREEREGGFTLIELLVVVLIIAILAAIAIPVFLRQREKAYQGDVNSTLRNSATAAESFAAEQDPPGDYTGLNQAALVANGLRVPSTQDPLVVTADADEYCVQVTETRLPAANPWRQAIYFSGDGKPTDVNACPVLTP